MKHYQGTVDKLCRVEQVELLSPHSLSQLAQEADVKGKNMFMNSHTFIKRKEHFHIQEY